MRNKQYAMSNNPKSSTAYLLKCYIWLINTISRGPISRAEIDEKWANATVNDYKTDKIPESTFHRWRSTVADLFNINIKCNNYGEYYIENSSELNHNDLQTHILNLFAVNQLLHDSKELQGQILFEPVPSGEKYLATIIEALRDKHTLQMTYQSFHSDQPSTFPVEPYCLKMFKQRWYMLAYSPDIDQYRVYALDRIQALEPTKQKYEITDSCAIERYFRNAYGVTALAGEPEYITISISEEQAPYLRTLPLHPSQKEIEPINGYPAFRFYVYPSDDFCQELYKYGSNLEVHEPQWLREQFAEDAEQVNEMYNLSK